MAVLRAHRIALLLRRRLDPPGHGRRTNATLRRQAALVEEAKGALARGARTVGPSSTKAHSAYICKGGLFFPQPACRKKKATMSANAIMKNQIKVGLELHYVNINKQSPALARSASALSKMKKEVNVACGSTMCVGKAAWVVVASFHSTR